MSEKTNIPQIRFKGFNDVWEQCKLGNFFDERDERSGEGEMISVTINSGIKKFSELNRFDSKPQDLSKYKKVEIGDIAYNSMRMWQGASGYSPYSGILSPAYTVIIPKKGVSSRFFSYVLKKPEMIQQFEKHSQGLTQDTWNLKFPAFSKIFASAPKSLEEQNKIAETLIKLDNLITLHQRKHEKYTNIKKALLEKMFPQNGEKVPQIRFKGFTEAWEQCKLGDVVSLRGRIGFRGYTREDLVPAHEGAVTFSPSDIDEEGHLSLENNDYISFEKYEESPEIKVKVGDILFTKTASIGKTAYVSELLEKSTINPQFALLTPNEKINGYYLFLSLRLDNFMQKVWGITGGSSIPTMSQEKLKELYFDAPNLVEQKQISKLFMKLDNLITLHQRECEKLKNIKKSLLEKMFV